MVNYFLCFYLTADFQQILRVVSIIDRTMKILLVEDSHKIALSIKKGLEQENFVVDLAFDGERGLDLALNEKYDIVILDLMLPLMSGLEVCKYLRKEGHSTPILMLTAKVEVSDRVLGLNVGADDYLVKPFNFSELLARVRALSRREKNFISEELVVDNLVLNQVTKEVKRGKKVITLSKREFLLLEFLMKNKGKVFSKEQLVTYVWQYDADILSNTVEVYIGYLRNKIDKPFVKSKQLIETVRGFGYKIIS